MANLLIAEKLEKTYGSGDAATQALRGVSFEVEEAEFASIIGQSGSGKSTLLNLLGLLDTPSGGTVTYRDRNAGGLSRKERSSLRNSLIGFVFQFHYLLPEFTVFENITMPALIGGASVTRDLRKRVDETLELLGLEGLGSKNANAISGGQKQRVAIARALINRPALILADEPTGNLDTANSDLVYDLFRQVSKDMGTAFLIVTHDRNVAQRTDRVLEVQDGQLVQDVRNSYTGAT